MILFLLVFFLRSGILISCVLLLYCIKTCYKYTSARNDNKWWCNNCQQWRQCACGPQCAEHVYKKIHCKACKNPHAKFYAKTVIATLASLGNATPSVTIAIIVNGKNNRVQNCTKCARTGTPICSIFCMNLGNCQNEI